MEKEWYTPSTPHICGLLLYIVSYADDRERGKCLETSAYCTSACVLLVGIILNVIIALRRLQRFSIIMTPTVDIVLVRKHSHCLLLSHLLFFVIFLPLTAVPKRMHKHFSISALQKAMMLVVVITNKDPTN